MSRAHPKRLGVELEFYENQKIDWLKSHRGEFVVIKGKDVFGFFSEFHTAYCTAAETYGVNTEFLVKRILLQEPVFVIL